MAETSAILEDIGLTKAEAKVYLALLELGSSTTGNIVDRSGASSSKIYEILEKLIQKGLVSYVIKSGTKHFEASPPARIVEYLKDKEKRIIEQAQNIKKILPELELKQKLSEYKSEAKIYRGMKGLETAFYESLKLLNNRKEDDMLVIGIPKRSDTVNQFFVRFAKYRAKKGFRMKALFNEEARSDLQAQPENLPCAEVRFTPEITPAAINIFKNRVIIFPEAKAEPLLIVIDNKEIADSFRVQFDRWWNTETTVAKGMDALKKVIFTVMDDASKGLTEYHVFGATFGSERGLDRQYVNFFREIHTERAKRGIPAKLLFSNEVRGIVEKNKKELYDEKNAEVRFLQAGLEFPIEIFTSKDKTFLTIQEKEPTIITIDNKKITDSFRRLFSVMWEEGGR